MDTPPFDAANLIVTAYYLSFLFISSYKVNFRSNV